MISRYAQIIKEYADEESEEIIPNGGIHQAAALIDNLFSHAKQSMKIFSSRLHPGIYESEEVLASAKLFFKNKDGRKAQILLQDTDELSDLGERKFLKLCRDFSDQCEFKKVGQIDKNEKSHFVIMDNTGFRFCPDKELTAAIASFNNPKIVTNLGKQFDIIFSRGVHLSSVN